MVIIVIIIIIIKVNGRTAHMKFREDFKRKGKIMSNFKTVVKADKVTVGVFFLYATIAFGAFMQVHAFNTFLVMFNDMIIVGRNITANQYLASSFALGFAAVPLYVMGILLRGWSSKRAFKWGTIAVFASVLAAIVWLVVIILMSVAVALNPF